jgi:RNA-binding protein NOB1
MDEVSSLPSSSTLEPRIESLVLDAGPLVTQSPLRGLAKKYYIPYSVVEELKDKRARDHLTWLQSEAAGCQVEIIQPGPEAMVAVTAFSKQTGDYSVLSRPDMNVLALTYAIETQKHGTWRIRDQVGGKTGQQKHSIAQQEAKVNEGGERSGIKKEKIKAVKIEEQKGRYEEHAGFSKSADGSAPKSGDTDVELSQKVDAESFGRSAAIEEALDAIPSKHIPEKPLPDEENGEEEDSEDDEATGGEWITPENITKHKNRALGLVTDEDIPLSSAPASKSLGKQRTQIVEAEDGWSTVVTKTSNSNGSDAVNRSTQAKKQQKKNESKMTVACMTGDYAVQNVLLQMGLNLVGLEGQKIKQVRSWVLRCHACFKICKDSEKKFCPQCGNATLLRTSVTSTAPDSSSKEKGGMKIHLKKNYQYKNRGTIYSLPLPKAGRAGGAAQSVPILREDQAEWQKALYTEKIKRNKEEKALQKALERGTDSLSARYQDADELSMLLAGGSGKNRSMQTGLPSMGIGRKNPNERRRRKV